MFPQDHIARHTIFLSLGSNLGNRMDNIESARRILLQSVGQLVVSSPVYESEPWGFKSDHWFLNQVVKMKTMLQPFPLMEKMLEIEEQIGRERKEEGYTDRLIDLDILFYDDFVINGKVLTLPHPGVADRMFILKPLREIAPDMEHPLLKSSVKKLLKKCKDKGKVKKYTGK